MKKTYYTNVPESGNEDYQLPWFLKDDEKYVELMAAVSGMLSSFIAGPDLKQWERLNEAYHQVTHGPHRYEGTPREAWIWVNRSEEVRLVPYKCIWCNKDINNHR